MGNVKGITPHVEASTMANMHSYRLYVDVLYYTYTYLIICVYIYICMYIIYIYIYICMYVYVCVYIYIQYICTYVSLDQEIDPGPGCWGCASFILLGSPN